MTITKVVAIILAFTALTLAFVGGQKYQRNHDTVESRLYQVEAKVICHLEDETIFKDFNGDEWAIDKDERFIEGQRVILTLNTNGTATIEDDEIIEVR
jgi:hypothetical protein